MNIFYTLRAEKEDSSKKTDKKNTFYNRVVLNVSKNQYQLHERLPSPHK